MATIFDATVESMLKWITFIKEHMLLIFLVLIFYKMTNLFRGDS